jgi:hypothetical protein
MSESTHPIEAQVLLVAGATASVPPERLSALVERAQRYVQPRQEAYERASERVAGTDGLAYYLVDAGHWADVGDDIDLDRRESDAVRRAHTEQFKRDGRRLDRSEEFETALEIREVVVVEDDHA